MRYLWAFPVILSAQTYVDSKVCAGCHAEIARTYAQTGMGRSFYRARPETAKYFHEKSGTWYSMAGRDGEVFQKRWRVGPAGDEVLAREQRVDYVMGSGNHVRTYLHRTERGALVQLDLAWYSEGGGTWAMNPGHDREYTLSPRTIAYECMFCHNGYPKIPAGHEMPGSEALYTGDLPEGIDCQRCHGPGSEHVRTGGSGPIVNPARLSPERQMEVCMQCHLETTALPLPHAIVRYGRGPFSYRPGEALGDFELFFDHAPGRYENDFEIAHSAYRLRKSQCFLKSAGKLTCTTCHNSHDVPRGVDAVKHYDASCRTCHTTVAAAGHTGVSGCATCHMPKRRTQDVIHAVMTDHLIQRRPPRDPESWAAAEREEFDAGQYRGEVAPYYPSPLPRTPENLLYLAVAQVMQKSNLTKGLPRLAAELERQKPARSEFYVELGQAWLAAGKPVNAIAAFDEALKRQPGSSVILVNLGDALTEAGQTTRAITTLTQAVKTAPTDALLWYQLGIAHSTAKHPAEAVAALEKAVAADPDLAEAHNLLGELFAGGGNMQRAEAEIRAALTINPDYADALGNMGHLFAARGDAFQAAYYLAGAVTLKPKDVEVRMNYAAALLGLRQLDEALKQLDEVLRIRPGTVQAHFMAAQILLTKGDRAGAARHLRIAAQSPQIEIRRRAEEALRRIEGR